MDVVRQLEDFFDLFLQFPAPLAHGRPSSAHDINHDEEFLGDTVPALRSSVSERGENASKGSCDVLKFCLYTGNRLCTRVRKQHLLCSEDRLSHMPSLTMRFLSYHGFSSFQLLFWIGEMFQHMEFIMTLLERSEHHFSATQQGNEEGSTHGSFLMFNH